METSAAIRTRTGTATATNFIQSRGLFPFSSFNIVQVLELHSNPIWPQIPVNGGSRMIIGTIHMAII